MVDRWLPLIFALLIGLCVLSIAYGRENFYDIRGDYSYMDVLKALAGKSERSIVGSQEQLSTVRSWHIDNEPFSVAVDAVARNLETEGYDIDVTPEYLFIHRRDSVSTKKIYEVFQPYKKRWVVTESREIYRNALFEDERERMRDSLEALPSSVYRCELFVEGWSISAGRAGGVFVDGEISTKLSLPPQVPTVGVTVGIVGNRAEERLDFRRRYLVYLTDSAAVLRFGSETRRVQSSYSSEKILATQYESVYDGLTLRWAGPCRYRLDYRVGDTQVELVGVPDSVVSGSALLSGESRSRQWGIFRSKRTTMRELVIVARATIARLTPR